MSSCRKMASICCAENSFSPPFDIPLRTTIFPSTSNANSIHLKLCVYSSKVSIHWMSRMTSMSSKSTTKKSYVIVWFPMVMLSCGTRWVHNRRFPLTTLTSNLECSSVAKPLHFTSDELMRLSVAPLSNMTMTRCPWRVPCTQKIVHLGVLARVMVPPWSTSTTISLHGLC